MARPSTLVEAKSRNVRLDKGARDAVEAWQEARDGIDFSTAVREMLVAATFPLRSHSTVLAMARTARLPASGPTWPEAARPPYPEPGRLAVGSYGPAAEDPMTLADAVAILQLEVEAPVGVSTSHGGHPWPVFRFAEMAHLDARTVSTVAVALETIVGAAKRGELR